MIFLFVFILALDFMVGYIAGSLKSDLSKEEIHELVWLRHQQMLLEKMQLTVEPPMILDPSKSREEFITTDRI
jgi:hypothetical protein